MHYEDISQALDLPEDKLLDIYVMLRKMLRLSVSLFSINNQITGYLN